MRAIGFSEPSDSLGSNGDTISTISIHSLNDKVETVKKMPMDILRILETRRFEIEQEIIALDGAPSISAVIREMKDRHKISEIIEAVETALKIIQNILSNSSDVRVYRVKRINPNFQRTLGRLEGSHMLMLAIGFQYSEARTSNTTISTENSGIYYLKSLREDGFNISKVLSNNIGKYTFFFN